MKKIFGNINITWKKLIIFAIFIGLYTGLMAMLKITKDTSFRDIAITFEWWVLFGILIIINSKSPKDSAMKCFVFFLISQPLVYLIQVPFSKLGFGIFVYYKYWFIWTILTIPMGYIGYYIKKDKWWGLLILLPMLLLVSYCYSGFLSEAISFFPNHILSAIFCLATLIIYPLYIFKNKSIKIAGLIISIILIIIMTVLSLNNRQEYNTTILVSGGSSGIIFDDTYKVNLKDSKYGKVFIVYEENIDDYMVNASFTKTGKTEFTIESPTGEKHTFDLTIERTSYQVKERVK